MKQTIGRHSYMRRVRAEEIPASDISNVDMIPAQGRSKPRRRL